MLNRLLGTRISEMRREKKLFLNKKAYENVIWKIALFGLDKYLPVNRYHVNRYHVTAGNAWMRSYHCSYRCPSAKAPGDQYLQCWLNMHCTGQISYNYITVTVGNICKWHYFLKKSIQISSSKWICSICSRHILAHAYLIETKPRYFSHSYMHGLP